MKKTLIFMVCILLPIFVLAGTFNLPGVKNYGLYKGADSRGYREHQRVISYLEDGWEPAARMNFVYSPDHPDRVIEISIDQWDEDTAQWMSGFYQGSYEYNAQGRITGMTVYINFMGMQIPALKQTNVYDSQNRLSKQYSYSGNIWKNDDWEPVMRMHIIYGSGTTFEVYIWEGDDWDEQEAYTHSVPEFDSRGRLSQFNHYSSPDSSNWVLDTKQVFEYHAQDNSTGADFIEYMAAAYPLIILYEDEFRTEGMTRMTDSYLEPGSNNWVFDERVTWELNNQLQLLSRLEEEYSYEGWYAHWKNDFSYDVNGLLHQMIGYYKHYNEWYPEEKYEFFWEEYTSNQDLVLPKPGLKFSVHPNPFTDNLKIEADTGKNAPIQLEVYNLRGQKIYSQSTASTEINWNGIDMNGKSIAAGLYYIRLSQDGISSVKRVLKVK